MALIPHLQNNMRLLALVALALAIDPAAADSATYFVATTGNDSNPGTFAAPFRTIGRAGQIVQAGDTVLIRGGIYPSVVFNRHLPGTAAAPIIFEPYQNEHVIIDHNAAPTVEWHTILWNYGGSYVTLRGLEITDSKVMTMGTPSWCGPTGRKMPPGVYTGCASKNYGPSNNITFENLHVHNITGDGICGGGADFKLLNSRIHDLGKDGQYEAYGTYIEGPRMIVRGNTIYRTNGNGIRLGNTTDNSDNSGLVVENNLVYDVDGTIWWYDSSNPTAGTCLLKPGGNGIVGWGTVNSTYRNNIVVNNKAGGITVNSNTTIAHGPGSRVYNNTTFGNYGHGLMSYSYDTIRNNISFGNNTGGGSYPGIYLVYSGNTADHNLGTVTSAGSGNIVANNLPGDPTFVNAAGMDFRLQAGSPAIDRGAALAEVPTDFAGESRPQGGGWDIGAFEYVAGTGPFAKTAPGRPTGLRWR